MRERNPLAKPDYVGAFALLVGILLFLAYWRAGVTGLVLGYVLRYGRIRKDVPGPLKEWQVLSSLGIVAAFVVSVGLDYWQFLTLGLTTWLFLRLFRTRLVTLHISLPDSLGTSIRMRQTPVNLLVLTTAWKRRGGGQSVFLGRSFGRSWTGGVGAWNSQSVSTPQEYLRSYAGTSVLTERSLIFISNDGVTRAVVDVDDIVSCGISTEARNRLVVSYGGRTPKTVVLEYVADE